MVVKAEYSHLNGKEYMHVHHPDLLAEIAAVIGAVDAEACRTKVSKERGQVGRILYSPPDLNAAFKREFEARGWAQRRATFYVTKDEDLMRSIRELPAEEQRAAIEDAGQKPILSYNQTDFVKRRIAVEVQLGKYAFVAHDLSVKHLSFFVSDLIDVGVEIVPMKEMEREMSSGVPYYERDLVNVIRQGRGVPAVPLILLGVAP